MYMTRKQASASVGCVARLVYIHFYTLRSKNVLYGKILQILIKKGLTHIIGFESLAYPF